ncbi:MAG: PIG-L family deacetylase [Ruminococcus sp.]|nr:PIG-L family deacetylase [Ruminococcus sp.]
MELIKNKEKRKKLIAVLIIILVTAIVVISAVKIYKFIDAHNVEPISNSTLDSLKLDDVDKLMIVAHPDDETIWGGGHLMDGGYLVVSITGGRNEERKNEFLNAVRLSGNVPLILEYPDKVNGFRDSWDAVYQEIHDDLTKIMSLKSWKYVVTHNPHGEYGHAHHAMTSKLTTDVFNECGSSSRLYYFGKYYRAVDLPKHIDDLTPISTDRMLFKSALEACHASQDFVFNGLRHMIPYEEWTLYDPSKNK